MAQLRELNAMFTRLDKDGDGTVDAEEARTGCLRVSPGSFEARASHARKLVFLERRFFDAESTDADASIDRGARIQSKTVEKVIAFAICLPNKTDASRFSGPEHFLLARPVFSLRNRTPLFRRRIDRFRCRCLDRPRCSKTIENDRKEHSVR